MTSGASSFQVRREEENLGDIAREIGAGLKQFNEAQAGPLDWRQLVLSVRDDRGKLIAGLNGGFFWNSLFVEVLFVDEAHRGKGLGSALLDFAERETCERGYELVYLSTFSFQAPDFYVRQGYRRVGELAGTPRGATRYWFAKQLVKI